MKKELKDLLAEVAIAGIGQHCYADAEHIANALSDDEGAIEMSTSIRALSYINLGHYERALDFLEPFVGEYEELICLALLCIDKVDSVNKKEYWLKLANKSTSDNVRSLADSLR